MFRKLLKNYCNVPEHGNMTVSSEDLESNFENVGDSSVEKGNTKSLSKVIKLETVGATETSSRNENGTYQSNRNIVKGVKRKNNTCYFASVKRKQQKTSKSEEIIHLSRNPLGVTESLKLKEDACNDAKESASEKVLNCALPGCSKIFRKQKAYETHIKHFHGVFNFKKSEPIITASFYDYKKKAIDELDHKSSSNLKNMKTENIDDTLPTTSYYNFKFSDTEFLLPTSLMRGIEIVSAGRSVAEVIYEDFYEKKKLPGHTHKDLNASKYVCFDEKNLNTNDSVITTNVDKSLKNSEELISDIKNTLEEEHLYASKKVDESYNEYIRQKNNKHNNNSKTDSFHKLNEIKDPFKSSDELSTSSDIDCDNTISPGCNVDCSEDVCSYEEFVKKKEKEYLDLDSSLKNKFSILEEINWKKSAKNQDKISTAVSLVLRNMLHNPSFNSIRNLDSKVSRNKQIANRKNLNFIRRSFELCNCARNLREILFKCKQIVERLSDYISPKDKNNSHLPISVTDNTNKLLHYVFFLDILRDPLFTSTYIQHILTKTDINVLNKLTNPVSLYLTNTENELPNVKLRRDREFLQRNSDFFTVLLKIQKSCHILPYAESSISAEDLCRPPTRLRLEKSDYFAQVFYDIKTEKGDIFMQSYGVDEDLSVSPFVECVCDDYNVHKLSGFVLLPSSSVAKDMCVGLCFESKALSLGDCVFKLTSISEEIERIISEAHAELRKKRTAYRSTEMRNNLLIIFDLIRTETNSVFSSLNLISSYVNKLLELDNKCYLSEVEIELTKDSVKEIGKILEDLKDLKECKSIL